MNLAFSAGAIDLKTAFDAVTEYWSPKVVAQVNDQYVKVAKVRGELVWHSHAGEDELFYVVRGSLRIENEGGQAVHLPEGSNACGASRRSAQSGSGRRMLDRIDRAGDNQTYRRCRKPADEIACTATRLTKE
jgi:hypothetical protein